MRKEKKILCIGLGIFILMASYSFAEDVFVSEIGTKYHKETCHLVREKQDIKKIDKVLALEEGYAPCKLCYREDLRSKKQSKDLNKGKSDFNAQK